MFELKFVFFFRWVWIRFWHRFWFFFPFFTIYLNFLRVFNKAVINWDFWRFKLFQLSLIVEAVRLEKFFYLLPQLEFICQSKNILPWIATTFRRNWYCWLFLLKFFFFILFFFAVKVFDQRSFVKLCAAVRFPNYFFALRHSVRFV